MQNLSELFQNAKQVWVNGAVAAGQGAGFYLLEAGEWRITPKGLLFQNGHFVGQHPTEAKVIFDKLSAPEK